MSAEVTTPAELTGRQSLYGGPFRGLGDRAFALVASAFGLTVLVAIVWIGASLCRESQPAIHKFGISIFRNLEWDVPNEKYGILPFIYGTLYSSAIALCIAVPISVGAALFLTEIAPKWLATPLAFLIEMLAAVPSIIFGLWGFLVLCPILNTNTPNLGQFLADHFGANPLIGRDPPLVANLLAAGVVLAIMIVPVITSISREVIRAVPPSLREASLALGATRWETISRVVLKSAKSGIVGAVILGLGRAIGETVAVIMVIGNMVQIPKSILQPAYTMPGLLALQFKEAQNEPMQRAVLLEVALALFIITLIVNGLARLLILVTKQGHTNDSGTAARLKSWLGGGVRWSIVAWIAWTAGSMVWSDVATRGARGLLGPTEALLAGCSALALLPTAVRRAHAWRLWRRIVHAAMFALVAVCALAGAMALGFLVAFVIQKGAHAIHPALFLHGPKSPDDPTGGMLNGIVGTGVLVLIAALIGIPFGMFGGIYLAEFPASRLLPVVRFAADVLNGVPSIVMGMFGFALFVLPFKHFSAWAGGATLGIMMVPTIMRTTEEMLRLVPSSLRKASLGLGASRLATILRIVLPAASSGIVTGILLALARIAGETAPLLFTAFGNDAGSHDPSQPISSMTLEIYSNYSYGDVAVSRAWAGALVLLGCVLIVSIAARLATRRRYAVR